MLFRIRFCAGSFCACSFFFILFISSAMVSDVVAMPKKYSQLGKQPASQGMNVVDAPLQGDEDSVQKAYKIQLAQRLLAKASRLDWSGFNWTAYYAFFQRYGITFEDFLTATRNGGYQAISDLAALLVGYGLFDGNQDLAAFHIFSVLDSHNAWLADNPDDSNDSSNDFYARGNGPLLRQLAVLIRSSTGTVPLERMPFDVLAAPATTDIVTIMGAIQGSLSSQPVVTSLQLNNSLGGLLSVISQELGMDCEVPTPAQVHLSPTVSTVLGYFNSKGDKLRALAFLIGNPFEGIHDPYTDQEMRPESTLHATVASQLYSLWQASSLDIQAMLAQLAIQVFHLNFLELARAQQACQAEASPPFLVPSPSAVPRYNYGSVQGGEGASAILSNLSEIIKTLTLVPAAVQHLTEQMASARWVGVGIHLDAGAAVRLAYNRIQQSPGQFEIFMNMLHKIVGIEAIIDRIHNSLSSAYPQAAVMHVAPGIVSITDNDMDRMSILAAEHSPRGCSELYGAAAVRTNLVAITDFLSTTPGAAEQLVTAMQQNSWMSSRQGADLSRLISRGNHGRAVSKIIMDAVCERIRYQSSARQNFRKFITMLRGIPGSDILVRQLRDKIFDLGQGKR